jgi:hypothetical protein
MDPSVLPLFPALKSTVIPASCIALVATLTGSYGEKQDSHELDGPQLLLLTRML